MNKFMLFKLSLTVEYLHILKVKLNIFMYLYYVPLRKTAQRASVHVLVYRGVQQGELVLYYTVHK